MPINSEAIVELICDTCGSPLVILNRDSLNKLDAGAKRASQYGWTFVANVITCRACHIRLGTDKTVDAVKNGFSIGLVRSSKDWANG